MLTKDRLSAHCQHSAGSSYVTDGVAALFQEEGHSKLRITVSAAASHRPRRHLSCAIEVVELVHSAGTVKERCSWLEETADTLIAALRRTFVPHYPNIESLARNLVGIAR